MFRCEICDKEFDSPLKLGGHKSSHSRGKRKDCKKEINCLYCNKTMIVNQSDKKQYCSTECFKAQVQEDKNNRFVVIRSEKHGNHVLDITVKELEDYRQKQLVCEICGNKESIKNGTIKLSADHNHETFRFRGLLCYACNVKLAWLEKEWDSIKSYLERDSFKF